MIGILGLATFICDIVALYVHRQSDVYRQQKFQDVDINLLKLETLNNLADDMMSEVAKRKQNTSFEKRSLTDHVIGNDDAISAFENHCRDEPQQNPEYNESLCKKTSLTSTIHTNPSIVPQLSMNSYSPGQIGMTNSFIDSPKQSSLKHRQLMAQRSSPSTNSSSRKNETIDMNDTMSIMFHDEDELSDIQKKQQFKDSVSLNTKSNTLTRNETENPKRFTPKLETFL